MEDKVYNKKVSKPKIYSALHDFLISQRQNKNDLVYGSLMCDETKLKNDVYTNCTSGDTIELISGHKNIMDISDNL